MWVCVILLLTCMLRSTVEENEEFEEIDVHTLDDESFEHHTQASTGATTGDWLVLMTKDAKCSGCEVTHKELRKVAATYQNLKNIAVLDTLKSPLTLRRFKVSKEPVLMFFHHGRQWTYEGDMANHEAISLFVGEGFLQQAGHKVTPPLDTMELWKEDFAKEVTAALKEKRLPKGDALLVLSGGFLAVLALLYGLVCSSKAKAEEEEEEIREKKEQ